MGDNHSFRFDENKAYEDQLVSVLEASTEHPLSAAEVPRQPGVFVLFRRSEPVYVGMAKDLRSRLNRQLSKTVANRQGIDPQEITCRFLTIEKRWEVLRAKTALVRRYKPAMN
jgi:excinuclease UvrABC nuclease subunit